MNNSDLIESFFEGATQGHGSSVHLHIVDDMLFSGNDMIARQRLNPANGIWIVPKSQVSKVAKKHRKQVAKLASLHGIKTI